MKNILLLLFLSIALGVQAQLDTLVSNHVYFLDALIDIGSSWTYILDLDNTCETESETVIDINTYMIPDWFVIKAPDGTVLLRTIPTGSAGTPGSVQGYVEYYNVNGQTWSRRLFDMPYDHRWYTQDDGWKLSFLRIILTTNHEYVIFEAHANLTNSSIFDFYMHPSTYTNNGGFTEIHNYWPVCFDDEITIDTTLLDGGYCDTIIYDHFIIDPYFSGISYPDTIIQVWEKAPGIFEITGPSNFQYVIWNGEETDNYHLETYVDTIVIVEGVTGNGCYTSDTFNIIVFYKRVYIPNAFSPNDDGRNDIFTYYTPTTIIQEEIWIFDRWGGVKWHSYIASWDGRFNGISMDAGVFVYIIKLKFPNHKWEIYKGDITILK